MLQEKGGFQNFCGLFLESKISHFYWQTQPQPVIFSHDDYYYVRNVFFIGSTKDEILMSKH